MSDELNKLDQEREAAAAKALEAKDRANADTTDGSDQRRCNDSCGQIAKA